MKINILILSFTLLFSLFAPKSSHTYYITKVDNLRLREDQSTNSRIIRNLKKGEKLILLETGKSFSTNNIKGKWLKVFTENDNKIGWCFSGYLNETKEKFIVYENKIFKNNVSKIYFCSSDRNSSSDEVIDQDYLLKGLLIAKTKKLVIKESSTNKIIFEQNYNNSNKIHDFECLLSKKKGNLKYYLNEYLLTSYDDKKEITTETFLLINTPKKVKIVKNNETDNFKYEVENKNGYKLFKIVVFPSGMFSFMDFNKYIINLDKDNTITFYIEYDSTKEIIAKMPLHFEYLNSEKNVKNTILLLPYDLIGFQGYPIFLKFFNNTDFILQTSSGHEGYSNYFYYNSKTKNITNIFELLKKEIKDFHYYILIDIKEDKLIIDESASPWDQGEKAFEYIIFNKDTLKLISREVKKTDKPILEYFNK